MKNEIVYTLAPTIPLLLPNLVSADEPTMDAQNDFFNRHLRGADEDADTGRDSSAVVEETELPGPVTESYATRFESPLITVRGEDPILNYLTRQGTVRGSALFSGLLTLGSQQGALDAGALGRQVLWSPFPGEDLQRLSLGLDLSAMYGEVANGQVGIDPLSMWQLNAGLNLGYNFDNMS